MKKNLIKLGISFFVLIVMLLYIDKIYMDKEKAEEEKRLLSMFETSAKKLIFNYSDDQRFSFEKREQEWIMLEPKSFICESSKIDSIINQLKTMTYSQKLILNADSDMSFGFENPYLNVEVSDDENDFIMSFGEKTYDNKNYYMTLSLYNEEVFVVSSYIASMFNPDIYYYKSSKIYDFNEEEIKKIEIAGDNYLFTVDLNQEENEYYVEKNNEEQNINEEVAVRVKDDFKYLRAQRWLDIDKAGNDFDFSSPLYTVKINTENKNIQFLIIKPGSEIYGKLIDSTEVFVLPSYLIDELENLAEVSNN